MQRSSVLNIKFLVRLRRKFRTPNSGEDAFLVPIYTEARIMTLVQPAAFLHFCYRIRFIHTREEERKGH